MANPTTLQSANPAQGRVERAPITSAKPVAGAPFVRLSEASQVLEYTSSGNAFGGTINQPLKAVGGWLRRLRLYFTTSGFTSTGSVVAAADAPWNVIQSLLLTDANGQPVYNVDGFGLYLINLYSGQVGMGATSDATALPSYSAIQTSSGSGAGGFSFALELPLELDVAGWCALMSANASAVPQIQVNLAASASVYTTAPSTLGTMTVRIDAEFWAAPVNDVTLGPPDAGASATWLKGLAVQTVTTGQYFRTQLPLVGALIHTIIAVMRDNTGARVDDWPANDLQLWLDGVALRNETLVNREDAMARAFDGVTRPTGVIVYTRRDSVQQIVSNADTHDRLLSTTQATLIEIAGTAPTISNSPAQITEYIGMARPKSTGGVPYNHLSN